MTIGATPLLPDPAWEQRERMLRAIDRSVTNYEKNYLKFDAWTKTATKIVSFASPLIFFSTLFFLPYFFPSEGWIPWVGIKVLFVLGGTTALASYFTARREKEYKEKKTLQAFATRQSVPSADEKRTLKRLEKRFDLDVGAMSLPALVRVAERSLGIDTPEPLWDLLRRDLKAAKAQFFDYRAPGESDYDAAEATEPLEGLSRDEPKETKAQPSESKASEKPIEDAAWAKFFASDLRQSRRPCKSGADRAPLEETSAITTSLGRIILAPNCPPPLDQSPENQDYALHKHYLLAFKKRESKRFFSSETGRIYLEQAHAITTPMGQSIFGPHHPLFFDEAPPDADSFTFSGQYLAFKKFEQDATKMEALLAPPSTDKEPVSYCKFLKKLINRVLHPQKTDVAEDATEEVKSLAGRIDQLNAEILWTKRAGGRLLNIAVLVTLVALNRLLPPESYMLLVRGGVLLTAFIARRYFSWRAHSLGERIRVLKYKKQRLEDPSSRPLFIKIRKEETKKLAEKDPKKLQVKLVNTSSQKSAQVEYIYPEVRSYMREEQVATLEDGETLGTFEQVPPEVEKIFSRLTRDEKRTPPNEEELALLKEHPCPVSTTLIEFAKNPKDRSLQHTLMWYAALVVYRNSLKIEPYDTLCKKYEIDDLAGAERLHNELERKRRQEGNSLRDWQYWAERYPPKEWVLRYEALVHKEEALFLSALQELCDTRLFVLRVAQGEAAGQRLKP